MLANETHIKRNSQPNQCQNVKKNRIRPRTGVFLNDVRNLVSRFILQLKKGKHGVARTVHSEIGGVRLSTGRQPGRGGSPIGDHLVS
jgi:hypothetical protein